MADRETVKASRAAARKQLQDLENEQEQQEILHPGLAEVTIGGSPVKLHKLAAQYVRELTALTNLVMASANGVGPPTQRIAGVLVLDEYYRNTFIRLLARAHTEPKKADDRQVDAIAKEIDSKTSGSRGAFELPASFFAMLEQNNILEEIFPKAEPPAEA